MPFYWLCPTFQDKDGFNGQSRRLMQEVSCEWDAEEAECQVSDATLAKLLLESASPFGRFVGQISVRNGEACFFSQTAVELRCTVKKKAVQKSGVLLLGQVRIVSSLISVANCGADLSEQAGMHLCRLFSWK